MPRSRQPSRRAAIAAKNKLPNAVKQMEKADRKEKQEQAKIKKKKRSTKSKGGGPAKRNNRGKKGGSGGNVGNNASAFPGHGRRLDSEPGAVADAKKVGATRLVGASINTGDVAPEVDSYVSALMNMKEHHVKLFEKMKNDVADQVRKNTNNQKLASLLTENVKIEVAKGGTKILGGILLGFKKDYEDAAANETSSGTALDWKLCTATYKSDTRGGEAVDIFHMYPKDVAWQLIVSFFDKEEDQDCLSEENLPSSNDLFWSMGYHFVLQNDEFEPENLVDIYKEMDGGDRNWDCVHNLGERGARRNNPNYNGN